MNGPQWCVHVFELLTPLSAHNLIQSAAPLIHHAGLCYQLCRYKTSMVSPSAERCVEHNQCMDFLQNWILMKNIHEYQIPKARLLFFVSVRTNKDIIIINHQPKVSNRKILVCFDTPPGALGPSIVERECCLLVLNSVTSTTQWIRQPEAAWGCVWCLCASMYSDILGVRWLAGGGVGVLRTGPVAAGVRVYSIVSHL